MNKTEKAQMDNIVVALDNLYFLLGQLEKELNQFDNIDSALIKKLKIYKKKFIKNMDIIEETKDCLLSLRKN